VTAPTIGAAGANFSISGCPAATSFGSLTFTAPTASDACNGATVNIVSDVTSGNACSKTFTRTWNATDLCGNTSATASQTITVRDIIAPVFSNTPANVTIQCTAPLPPVANVTATDNCAGNVTGNIVFTETTQNTDCSTGYKQIVTRRWVVNDGCGNSATFTQIISVKCCETVCTLTQGAYGSPGGNICLPNGTTVNQTQIMINALTAAPANQVVFGRQDLNRYWVIRLTDVNQGGNSNIFKMLPGGGPSKVLGLDTYPGVPEYDNHPTWPVAPLRPTGPNAGSINNILLAQTITLYFNLSITGSHLGELPLGCDIIVADRVCGSLDPVPGTTQTVSFASMRQLPT
jgi:hypothetical protein